MGYHGRTIQPITGSYGASAWLHESGRVRGTRRGCIRLQLGDTPQAVGRQISHLSLQVLQFEVGVALGRSDPGVAQ